MKFVLYQQENIDEQNKTGLSDGNSSKAGGLQIKASLKNVYRMLKPPIVTQRVFDDLSICIVFQMILFLANEHVS